MRESRQLILYRVSASVNALVCNDHIATDISLGDNVSANGERLKIKFW